MAEGERIVLNYSLLGARILLMGSKLPSKSEIHHLQKPASLVSNPWLSLYLYSLFFSVTDTTPAAPVM